MKIRINTKSKLPFLFQLDTSSPDRVAGLEDEHGAGGVIVPVQALLPLAHPGPGGGLATLASDLRQRDIIIILSD